jgi:uncharacterized protein YqgC (DUF456 family)
MDIALLGFASLIAVGILLGPALGLGWTPFLVLLLMAGVAEGLEFLVSLRTTRRAGAGRSGMWGAVLGGLVGGLLGTAVLPLIGSLLGAALGAMVGAASFELLNSGGEPRPLLKIGLGAFFGTLLGRLGKIMVGVAQAVGWTAWLLESAGNPLASA